MPHRKERKGKNHSTIKTAKTARVQTEMCLSPHRRTNPADPPPYFALFAILAVSRPVRAKAIDRLQGEDDNLLFLDVPSIRPRKPRMLASGFEFQGYPQ